VQRFHLKVLARALDRFGESLEDVTAPPLSGVREVFHAWTANADAAYREGASSAEYRKCFAACVNTGSLLRQAWTRWQHAQSWLTPVAPLGGQMPTHEATFEGAPVDATEEPLPQSAPRAETADSERREIPGERKPARRNEPPRSKPRPRAVAVTVRASPVAKRGKPEPVPVKPTAKSRRDSNLATSRAPLEFDITRITRPTKR